MKEIDKKQLRALKNVGPATLGDLELLGIDSLEKLTNSDPDVLFAELQQKTGQKQDPCVWDVFAAIIHEAKTGEKQPWWHWTAIRKQKKR